MFQSGKNLYLLCFITKVHTFLGVILYLCIEYKLQLVHGRTNQREAALLKIQFVARCFISP